jgi:superfamily II DNA/RNA helicase
LLLDVAARGIDVDITHVVNYQLPRNRNICVQVVLVAGKLGTSIVIVTKKVNCVRFLLLKESSSKKFEEKQFQESKSGNTVALSK